MTTKERIWTLDTVLDSTFKDINDATYMSMAIGLSRLETLIRYNILHLGQPWGAEVHIGRFLIDYLKQFPEEREKIADQLRIQLLTMDMEIQCE